MIQLVCDGCGATYTCERGQGKPGCMKCVCQSKSFKVKELK